MPIKLNYKNKQRAELVHRQLHSDPLYFLGFHLTFVFNQAPADKNNPLKTTGLAYN